MSDITKWGFRKLGTNNYGTWSKSMYAALASKGYSTALEDPDDPNSGFALGQIGLCVQDCHLTTVSTAGNAHAAWEALAAMYQQQSNASLIRLKRELASVEKRSDETITEYIARINTIREQITTATGAPMEDADVIGPLLNGLPSKYSIMKMIIETMPDLPSMADITAKLLMVEADQPRGNDTAYYGANPPKPKQQVYVPPHRKYPNRYKNDSRKSRWGDGGSSNDSSNGSGSGNYDSRSRETRSCYYCGKPGHLKKDCRKLKADNARQGSNRSARSNTVIALSAIHEEKEYTSEADFSADYITDYITDYNPDYLEYEDEENAYYKLRDDDYNLYIGKYPTRCRMDFDKEAVVNNWYVDTGATKHVTGMQHILHRFRPLEESSTITYGNGATTPVDYRGDVILARSIGPNFKLVLKDVLYAPDHTVNLISVSAAAANGVEFRFIRDRCYAFKDDELVLAGFKDRNTGLYRVISPPVYPKQKQQQSVKGESILSAVHKKDDDDMDPAVWHRRNGHMGYSSLRKMVEKDMVKGLPISVEDIDKAKEVCEVCSKTKLKRLPFKPSESKTTAPLQLIHMDLCGPLDESLGKAKYMATFLDDYSSYSVIVLLKNKSDAPQAIKDVFTLLENQLDLKVKKARTDGGGEFVNAELSSYFKQKGIEHQITMPYSPQQNGKAERLNLTIEEKARAMLCEANLPKSLWGEAVNTANYLRNRSPAADRDCTPYELLFGKKPDISNLRTFGCEAYVHIPKVKRGKLDNTAEKGIMVGYEPNGYRILLDNNRVQLSRDVLFNEKVSTPKSTDKEAAPPKEAAEGDADEDTLLSLVTESEDEDDGDDHGDDNGDDNGGNGGGAGGDNNDGDNDGGAPTPAGGAGSSSDQGNAGATSGATRTSARGNRGVPAPRLGHWVQAACVDAPVIITEPETYEEACNSDYAEQWRLAMDEEFNSLIQNDTWSLEELPAGVKPIPVKWIYKVKKDASGQFERFKARLVVKGFRQKEGIDYTEVFAPVSKFTTVRTLLAKAAAEDLELQQIDIKTAFLHGELEEDIYMEQPVGYEEGKPGLVCKLNKSLYGLKQAPRAWYTRLTKELESIGFVPSAADPSLFTLDNKASTVYLLIYVDDILIAGKDKEAVDYIKEELLTRFEGRDLGEVTSYLGINLTRDRANNEIKVDQTAMINSIIKEFGMDEAKTRAIPLSPATKMTKDEGELIDKEQFPYGTLVGKLMFLAVSTRPDIAYSVGTLARFISAPTLTHWQAAKGVVRYLAATKDRGITFRGRQLELMGFCDADYAGDLDTRKSTTGYVFTLNGGAISWNSKRQPTVAASTTEAEYMSAAAAVKEGLWLRKLLSSLDISVATVHILCDNQSAIKLLKNPIFSARSKHIDVAHHFARERVQSKEVTFHYVPTTEMAADMLTKVLPLSKHLACCGTIGVV